MPTELKKRVALMYDVLFCCLALVAVYLSICDMTSGQSAKQLYIDNAITVIFIADYFIRLLLSTNKKSFFKNNVFDLIAVIPFNSLFKIFRVLKVLKILKILKLARLSAYFARFYKRVQFFFEINGLKYMVVACATCIVLGGAAIHFFEGTNFVDGLWWSFVTATTVGYGDISPATTGGRLVAAVLMITGIGLIGSLTSTITALFFQKHESSANMGTKNEIIKTLQLQLNHFEDLSDSDVETICRTIKNLHEQK